METTQARRHQSAVIPRSPHLLRSKSGTPTVSLHEIHTLTSKNSSQRPINRSTSTTKSRINKDYENLNPSMMVSSIQKKPQENKDSFVKFLQRSQRNSADTAKKTRSVSGSPSAWALSPGRSSPCVPVLESLGSGGLNSKSSGGGVLKYFRQKKVSPIQEEGFHRYRVLHNRLLQWRFANARAEAAMNGAKVVTEEKLFSVWLRIFRLRNSIVEKQVQVQKLKHEIKLFCIINSEMCLLKEWTKLEKRNFEAVGKLARTLSAVSIRLPLVRGAKANVVFVYEAMSMAMGVMDNIEAIINKFFSQAERTCYLLTELMITVKQQRECLEELEKTIAMVASLKARENSLRVHHIQATEARRRQDH